MFSGIRFLLFEGRTGIFIFGFLIVVHILFVKFTSVIIHSHKKTPEQEPQSGIHLGS